MQDNLVPKEYVTLMQRHALNACPLSSYADVARTITEQLGAPPATLFATFERKPLASASLAQVHHATLQDGTELAVKVQHRRIKETGPADLAVMRCASNAAILL